MDSESRWAFIKLAGCVIALRRALFLMDYPRKNQQLPGMDTLDKDVEAAYEDSKKYLDEFFKIFETEQPNETKQE